jgi:predicted short-subunit dehydrogenase-like oxidoreductase (DUF2520 family)
MISITIIGSGNVAYHLAKVISTSSNLDLVQMVMRNPANAPEFIEKSRITSDFDDLKEVDLFLVAVSDESIEKVIRQLARPDRLIAHTSGASDLNICTENYKKGVFYPLQTFSKSKEISFKSVPICLEAGNEIDYKLLEKVANTVSQSVYAISSRQRKSLHVAAVFVCNFVNHLYAQGEAICNEHAIDFEILKPLVLETAHKMLTLSPSEAQTGPAKRHDTSTINNHIQFLSDDNQKEMYKLLTQSIINHGKKL